MSTSLLVTNDFPPKVGGIQSYLYELWRRLPTGDTTVFTTAQEDTATWDRAQSFRVVRGRERVFLPTPDLTRRVEGLAREVHAGVVFLDPMVPLGLVGPRLSSAPYVVILHGSEVTVPGSLPLTRPLARRVLTGAVGVVAAGSYAAQAAVSAAGRPLPTLVLPPGVDPVRFRPIPPAERAAARTSFGLDPELPLVLGVSRLVPRKGFDVLLEAVGMLGPEVQVAIAGTGRDRGRLVRVAARVGCRARLLGRVPEAALPALYGCADVFAMPCRDRWGGLEAEGFGIVFVEAGACGVPSVAGRSGGTHEAVIDGETGLVVDPRDVQSVRDALATLLHDEELRTRLGAAARARAAGDLSYDRLAQQLVPLAAGDLGVLTCTS